MQPHQVLFVCDVFWLRRLKTLWPWWNGAWEMMQEEVKA